MTIPPHYGDPFYRGRGRGNRGNRGRREWIQERQMERSSGNYNRGNGQNNGMRSRGTTSASVPQTNRQDDEWSMPLTTERREDTERQQIPQASSSVVPPPTEERLFTDWSSEGSPQGRATQRGQSARSREPSETIIQREPTERETRNTREIRQVPESVMTRSSTQEQTNQAGARVSDHESNTAVVEIRLTRDEEIVHAPNQGVQVPTPDGGLSSLSTHTERTIMPQLDGPASAHPQRRQPMPTVKRTTIPGDDGFPDDSDSDSHDIRSHDNRRYPGRRYQ